MESLLKELLTCRKKIKANRKKFWEENKKNFETNIQKLVKLNQDKLPKGWKVYLVASSFLSDKEIKPYDYDAWSVTELVTATQRQGFEIMIFFNKSGSGFLSAPALLSLVVHEIRHANQAAEAPEHYHKGSLNDVIAREREVDAEKEVKKISEEFRRQSTLENVLYSFDTYGWKGAKEMAILLHKGTAELYAGGYDQEMTEQEYIVFLESEKKRDINIFLNYFLK